MACYCTFTKASTLLESLKDNYRITSKVVLEPTLYIKRSNDYTPKGSIEKKYNSYHKKKPPVKKKVTKNQNMFITFERCENDIDAVRSKRPAGLPVIKTREGDMKVIGAMPGIFKL